MVDHLLNMCVNKYKKMLEVYSLRRDCSELPDSLLVHYVKGSKHKGAYVAKKRLRAWRFVDGELFEIPADAKPVERPDDTPLYCEPHAEFGICRLTKKAFINIYCGKQLGMGFVYDISTHGINFMVCNEKVLWKL